MRHHLDFMIFWLCYFIFFFVVCRWFPKIKVREKLIITAGEFNFYISRKIQKTVLSSIDWKTEKVELEINLQGLAARFLSENLCHLSFQLIGFITWWNFRINCDEKRLDELKVLPDFLRRADIPIARGGKPKTRKSRPMHNGDCQKRWDRLFLAKHAWRRRI